ncbi:uncharacterized protein L203_105010 [Cryptococcus depauperatus CBS 7841]|uniref:Transmembrane protein n=1 Tax=Cryptococcus depauperatus CBS 7841 TaxID=1295531 RepID=A0AAJ8JWL5_9TREE
MPSISSFSVLNHPEGEQLCFGLNRTVEEYPRRNACMDLTPPIQDRPPLPRSSFIFDADNGLFFKGGNCRPPASPNRLEEVVTTGGQPAMRTSCGSSPSERSIEGSLAEDARRGSIETTSEPTNVSEVTRYTSNTSNSPTTPPPYDGRTDPQVLPNPTESISFRSFRINESLPRSLWLWGFAVFFFPLIWFIGMCIIWMPLEPLQQEQDPEAAQKLDEMIAIIRKAKLKYAKRCSWCFAISVSFIIVPAIIALTFTSLK